MLNRNRPNITDSSSEPAAQLQAKLDLKVAELQKETMDQSLAKSFPDWDLNPPVLLVRRRSSKLL